MTYIVEVCVLCIVLYNLTAIPSDAPSGVYMKKSLKQEVFKGPYPVTNKARTLQDDIYCPCLSVRALSNQTMTHGEK